MIQAAMMPGMASSAYMNALGAGLGQGVGTAAAGTAAGSALGGAAAAAGPLAAMGPVGWAGLGLMGLGVGGSLFGGDDDEEEARKEAERQQRLATLRAQLYSLGQGLNAGNMAAYGAMTGM